ncbi:hypothetical protein IJ732_00620 [bacterium]|nr:hypothetical protein [bacterium]
MRIYPINQSPIMFRGSNQTQQNHVMKRYCEPRTGAYYYYDATQFEKENSQNTISNFFKNLKNKFNNLSKDMSDTFIRTNSDNADADDVLWL